MIKHVVYKVMLDYEKEEKWLNEMAVKGLNLEHYDIGRYFFSEGKPGEYIYRIELLRHSVWHPESIAYMRSLEEMGVECVSAFYNWAYFRKKAADGPFELFSDNDSKIEHCGRVYMFTRLALAINLSAAALNIFIYFAVQNNMGSSISLICAILSFVLSMVLAPLHKLYKSRLNKLKAERCLRE